MTQLLEYALIENEQITRTEWFKRPELVPSGDWYKIKEWVTVYDPATHMLGEKVLQVNSGGSPVYVWTIIPIPPPPVPAQIQMWQARAMLIRMGLIDRINQAIAASGNQEIINAWEYAPNVVRRSIFVAAIASALDLDDDTLDTLFIEGAKIK